jgi:predicted dehydrogenase
MKKKLRVGIVGSGFAATFYFKAIQSVTGVDVEIAGVFSSTRENRECFAEHRGIPAADSLEKLIDTSDIVHICTPVSIHE